MNEQNSNDWMHCRGANKKASLSQEMLSFGFLILKVGDHVYHCPLSEKQLGPGTELACKETIMFQSIM